MHTRYSKFVASDAQIAVLAHTSQDVAEAPSTRREALMSGAVALLATGFVSPPQASAFLGIGENDNEIQETYLKNTVSCPIHQHSYIHITRHTHTHTHAHAHARTRTLIHIHIHTHAHAHARSYTFTCIHTRTHIHTYIHTCTSLTYTRSIIQLHTLNIQTHVTNFKHIHAYTHRHASVCRTLVTHS